MIIARTIAPVSGKEIQLGCQSVDRSAYAKILADHGSGVNSHPLKTWHIKERGKNLPSPANGRGTKGEGKKAPLSRPTGEGSGVRADRLTKRHSHSRKPSNQEKPRIDANQRE